MKIAEIVAGIKPYVLGWIRDYSQVGQVTASNAPKFIPLSAPLTSTSWDGDSFSTTGKTILDLSSVFGTPAKIRAILVEVSIRDSGSAANDCSLLLSPNSTDASGLWVDCSGQTNDSWERQTMVVPCTGTGDVYYQIYASGAGTMDVYLRIWGYWV